jgi:hypothetical protein
MKPIQKQVREQSSNVSSLQGGPSWGRSYGRVSIELKISRRDLRASVRGGEDWVTIKDIMDFLGFDVKLVNVVIVGDKDSLTGSGHSHRTGPGPTVVEIKRTQRDSPSRSSLTKPETTSGVRRRIR